MPRTTSRVSRVGSPRVRRAREFCGCGTKSPYMARSPVRSPRRVVAMEYDNPNQPRSPRTGKFVKSPKRNYGYTYKGKSPRRGRKQKEYHGGAGLGLGLGLLGGVALGSALANTNNRRYPYY